MCRRRFCRLIFLSAALAGVLLASPALAAAPTAANKAKAKAADAELNKAAKAFTDKKYEQAAISVTLAQKLLSELSASKDNAELMAPIHARLIRARGLLIEQGIELRPLDEELLGEDKPAAAEGKVSFANQVAPILVAKCSGCHIRATKGGLSMASFTALTKGSRNGPVIDPGKSKASRIMELMESGDMPRGGTKATPEELALVARWIDAGAKFDGKDPAAPLSKAAPAQAAGGGGARLYLVQATGKEEVHFARDVGPTIVAKCIGCHNSRVRRGELMLETFAELLMGGESGALLVPGKPAESLIVKKLRGTAGERMPLDQAPLSEDVIAKFEKWIAEGAKFDGTDSMQPLAELVAWVHVQTLSHEELSKERGQLAAKNWRLTLPDAPAEKGATETKNFVLYGNVGEEALTNISRIAEEQSAKLLKQFKVPADEPFVKGRLTIYVFRKRYDYGEIGTMVEKRDIPTNWRGHWRFAPPDAYACVLQPSHGEYLMPLLVTQQIAGAYLASQGHLPRWFVEGSARALAARLEPKDPQVKRWDDQVAPALAECKRPDDFVTGALPQEESDALGYGFVKALIKKPGPYQATLASIRGGAPFDQAFLQHFHGTPSQLAAAWIASGPTKRGR
jgi:mono/diheme cytochrome c family protein